LQAVTAKALEVLKAGCSSELPSSPTERIEAMRTRLVAMLQAVRIVRPALETFYQSLNDEQKMRFDAVAYSDDQDWPQPQEDSMRLCGGSASGFANAPLEQAERSVQPVGAQRPLLGELQNAMLAAAEFLKSSCPSYRILTRVARLEVVEQRLKALVHAVEIVQPALGNFYSSLSDIQKDRFNRLGLDGCVHIIRQGKSASVCLAGAKSSSSAER
jgi:LTXXQ motif family protein